MKFFLITTLLIVVFISGFPALGSNIDWLTGAGGQYGSAANWSSDPSVPGAADNVFFRVAGNPAYKVLFDDPAADRTNSSLTVSAGNMVELSLAGRNYGISGVLSVTGTDNAHLSINSGFTGIGGNFNVANDNGNSSLAISNSAVVRVGWAMYCRGQGVVRISGSGTDVEVTGNALYFDAGGQGESLFVVEDGAVFRITSGSSSYITSSTNNTSMLLVTNGAVFIAAIEQNSMTRIGPYAGTGGRVSVVGNGSLGVFDAVYMLNHAMLEVGAGAAITVMGGRWGSAYDQGLITGGGRISSQTISGNSTFGFNLFDSTVLAPGDSGVGTLTIEDSSGLRFRGSNTMRLDLAGKSEGQYGRVSVVSDKIADSSAIARFDEPGVVIEVSVRKPYFNSAAIGDTFDIIEAYEIFGAAAGSMQESDDNFPVLNVLTPKFDGVLSVETIGSRQALRLTITEVPARGTIFKVR